jgi:hypothetical protein
MHACGPAASPGPWSQVNTAPAGFASGNLCGGPEIGPLDSSNSGSLFAEDVLNSPAEIPDGARAGWTITAPPGATITGITYYRTLATHGDRDVAAGLFQADGSVLEQCRIALPFGSPSVCSMPNNQVPVAFGNLNTTSLFLGVLCDIVVNPAVTACVAGGAPLHNMQAYMYSAKVTMTENAAPTVTGIGGALWGGGLVSGTVSVSFSGSDATGIREQAVQNDSGQTVLSRPNACDYTQQPPCPQSPNATLNVDTTRVADGPHTFRLVVTDTAGNSTVVNSPPVVVDNYGPPPPLGLIATARAGSDTIALTWTNPPTPPAPVTGAIAQLCRASCSAPVSVNAFGNVQVPAPGPGVYVVRVWLLDAAGRGGPHNAAVATVTVPSSATPPPPPPPPSGTPTRIVAILHGRQLRVSGPITVSGRVSVSWRSKIRGRTVGHGSRAVTIRANRLRVTFAIPRRARVAAATLRVAVRRGGRVVGKARARRSRR